MATPRAGSEVVAGAWRRGRVPALTVAVGLLVLVTYWPALSGTAVFFDDHAYVIRNPLVQDPGWSSVRRFLGEIREPSSVRAHYQPLSMISLMLNRAAADGPYDFRPFHRTSVALHVMNAMLVVVFLYLLFGRAWPAATAGLLFGLHPLTVEPVVWVSEQKTLLAAFFVCVGLVLYVGYVRTQRRGLLVACCAAYVLGLLSKPTSTPLPALLLLLDFWPLRRLSWKAIVEKVAFFAVGGISVLLTYASLASKGYMDATNERSLTHVGMVLCYDIIFYLCKIVWPVRLSSHYPVPAPFGLSDRMVLAGVIGTCLLIPALLASLRWTRALLTSWLFFFVATLSTMTILVYGEFIASFKFIYVSAVGLLLAVAWLLNGLLAATTRLHRRIAARGSIVAGVAVLAMLEASATRGYVARWRDTEGLFRYLLELTPKAPMLHGFLASVLWEKGSVDEAVEHFNESVRGRPDAAKQARELASLLRDAGRADLGAAELRLAMEIERAAAGAALRPAFHKDAPASSAAVPTPSPSLRSGETRPAGPVPVSASPERRASTAAVTPGATSRPTFVPLKDAIVGEWCRYRMRDDQAQEVRVVGVEGVAVVVEVKMFRQGRPLGLPAVRREPVDRDPTPSHPARVLAEVSVAEAVVEAGGAAWPCQVVTEAWVDEEVAYVRRSWCCGKAPVYGLVRMEMTAGGRPSAAMELIDYGPR